VERGNISNYRILDWRNSHVYELRDLADEVIDGIFYEQELTRVEKKLRGRTVYRRRGGDEKLINKC